MKGKVHNMQIILVANPILETTGYECQTTFWDDFSIADHFGISAIKDTYNRAFSSWKNNVKYITELVIVLNHKIWQHYESNEIIAEVYNSLWMKTHEWCANNLKGEDLSYYCRITD